jgi:hypothetical protein
MKGGKRIRGEKSSCYDLERRAALALEAARAMPPGAARANALKAAGALQMEADERLTVLRKERPPTT